MFDSFTEAARRAVSRALWHAGRLQHPEVRGVHLLLGTVDVLAEASAGAMDGIDVERLRAQLALRVRPEHHRAAAGQLPWAATATRACEGASAMARAHDGGAVDIPHLLLTLLSTDGDIASIADTALEAAGSTACEFLDALRATLGEVEGAAPSVVLAPMEARADLTLAFHPELSPQQIAVAVEAVGEWYRACGGAGLQFRFAPEDRAASGPEGAGPGLCAWLRCISAKVSAVTRRDWRGRPGRAFRQGLDGAAQSAGECVVGERGHEARGQVRKQIEGMSLGPYEGVVRDAAQAEEVRTRTVLAQRAGASDVVHRARRNDRVRSEGAGDRADRRGLDSEALCRLLETLVRGGMAIDLRDTAIDVVPHDGAIDSKDVRGLLGGFVAAGVPPAQV